MLKAKKVRTLQIAVIALVLFVIMAPVATAEADTTITLQGVISAATIDVSIDKSVVALDMATGVTSASDSINVSSTSTIPVEVKLQSFTQTPGSWNPTLITAEPTGLGLTDAQTQARLRVGHNSSVDFSVAPAYQALLPTGTGASVSSYNGTTYAAASYPASMGVIADSDGVTPKTVAYTTTLEASKKRILSKAFEGDLVLNFSAADTSGL